MPHELALLSVLNVLVNMRFLVSSCVQTAAHVNYADRLSVERVPLPYPARNN